MSTGKNDLTAVQPDLYNIGQEGWMMGFKERLKEARIKSGMTQGQVAEAMGAKSRNSYIQYETGRRLPGFEQLIQFAQLFNVSADWLLGLSGSMEIHDRIPLDNEE